MSDSSPEKSNSKPPASKSCMLRIHTQRSVHSDAVEQESFIGVTIGPGETCACKFPVLCLFQTTLWQALLAYVQISAKGTGRRVNQDSPICISFSCLTQELTPQNPCLHCSTSQLCTRVIVLLPIQPFLLPTMSGFPRPRYLCKQIHPQTLL